MSKYELTFRNSYTEDECIYVVCIKEGVDVIRVANKFVEYHNSQETEPDRKKWYNIEFLKVDECLGCKIDAPGQRSHMTCPEGCLHIPGCGECDQLPYKFNKYQ